MEKSNLTIDELLAVQVDWMLERVEGGEPVSWVQVEEGRPRVYCAIAIGNGQWQIWYNMSQRPITRRTPWVLKQVRAAIGVARPPDYFPFQSEPYSYGGRVHIAWRSAGTGYGRMPSR